MADSCLVPASTAFPVCSQHPTCHRPRLPHTVLSFWPLSECQAKPCLQLLPGQASAFRSCNFLPLGFPLLLSSKVNKFFKQGSMRCYQMPEETKGKTKPEHLSFYFNFCTKEKALIIGCSENTQGRRLCSFKHPAKYVKLSLLAWER